MRPGPRVRHLHGPGGPAPGADPPRATASLLVVDLWDAVEPRTVAEALDTEEAAATLRLTCVATALDAACLPIDIARGERLSETGHGTRPATGVTWPRCWPGRSSTPPPWSCTAGTRTTTTCRAPCWPTSPPLTPIHTLEIRTADARRDRSGPAPACWPTASTPPPPLPATRGTARSPPSSPAPAAPAAPRPPVRGPRRPGHRVGPLTRPVLAGPPGPTACSAGTPWRAGCRSRTRGPWLASLPEAAWDLVSPARRAAAALDWTEALGDRVQHLVFTGPDLDRARIHALLDSCLLTPEEARGGILRVGPLRGSPSRRSWRPR